MILAVAEGINVPIMPMIQKRLSIRGWPSGTAQDSEDTIQFATVSGVKCRVEKFSLDEAQKAYDHMMSGKARFRAVLAIS